MKAPYLGKSTINWCDKCNLPLLESCDLCGSQGRKIQLTPPGDLRVAWEGDVERILKLAKEFGLTKIDSQIYLNRISGLDRNDEIYIDGHCVGILSFDPADLKFKLLPRPEMARYIKVKKKCVQLFEDAEPFILQGKTVLAPGVKDADPSIQKGEYVFVLGTKAIATGIAKMNGKEMVKANYGPAVRTKHIIKEINWPKPKSELKKAVKANTKALAKKEKNAINLMRSVSKKHDLPRTVSFSGGKDSLVTFLLASEAFKDFKTFFVDTGIEFPETRAYIKKLAKTHPIIIESAGDSFWDAIKTFGPPGRDYRHCCKVCKLGPATRLINKHFPGGCLTFGGERRYESELRARRGFEGKNPWVPNQYACYPIKDWNALAVWLYILSKKKPFNPLYKKGYERIGCYPCPASSLAEFKLLKEVHPALHKRLLTQLKNWGRKYYSVNYIKHGFWRWKTLTNAQFELADRLGINTKAKKVSGALTLIIEKGVSPCKAGGYSIEGTLGSIDLKKLQKTANLLGTPKYSKKLNMLKIHTPDAEINVYPTGHFRIVGEKVESLPELLFRATIKAMSCAHCGICISVCPVNAIDLTSGLTISSKCTHCMACMDRCPVLKYRR